MDGDVGLLCVGMSLVRVLVLGPDLVRETTEKSKNDQRENERVSESAEELS